MQQHKLSANMFASSCLLLSMLSVCSSSSCCNRGAIPCLITLDSEIVFMKVAIHLPPIKIKGPSSWTFDSTARSQLVGMYRSGSTKNTVRIAHVSWIRRFSSRPQFKKRPQQTSSPSSSTRQDYHFRHPLQPDRRFSK